MWNDLQDGRSFFSLCWVPVMAAVESLHARLRSAHANQPQPVLPGPGAAVYQARWGDFPEAPLCQHAAANGNNINSPRLLRCVFSNSLRERCGRIERSAICRVEWIQKWLVCVCVCSVHPKKGIEARPSLNRKTVPRLMAFCFLWDHVRRSSNSHPLPANRPAAKYYTIWKEAAAAHRWGTLVDSVADFLNYVWNSQKKKQKINNFLKRQHNDTANQQIERSRLFLIWLQSSFFFKQMNICSLHGFDSVLLFRIGAIWRICCVADGGIVRQIQGKRSTERCEVILWKFSFPCGARGSGLTHDRSQKKEKQKHKNLFRLSLKPVLLPWQQLPSDLSKAKNWTLSPFIRERFELCR